MPRPHCRGATGSRLWSAVVDTARARPEDLDELPLDRLRDLELEAGSGPGQPAYVASASGVARRGRNVY